MVRRIAALPVGDRLGRTTLVAKSKEKEGDGRRVRMELERRDLPVLMFCGWAKVRLADRRRLAEAKNCSQNCKSEGSKEGGWVYTDQEPEARMEFPAFVLPGQQME